MPTNSLSKLFPVLFLITLTVFPSQHVGNAAGTGSRIALSQPLTIRWRYNSDVTLGLTPAFNEERIYLPLAGGTLISLGAKDGQLLWRSEMGGELSASPVADDSAVYVASEVGMEAGKTDAGVRRATGTLRALGRAGGVTQWMRTLATPLRGSLTLSSNELIAGGNDGRLYAFNKKTGAILWSIFYSAPFSGQPIVSEGKVYAGSEDGNLLAIDEATGEILWRYRTKGPVRGPAVTANGTVYFGSGDGYVYAVRTANGLLIWRKRTGAGVQAVARVEDALLVASLDNFVYRFSLNGTRVWKRQLPGRISSQPLTAEDGALFTPLSSSAGVVLGLVDGRPINTLPTGDDMNTSASPIAAGDAVLLTTEHALIAFAQPK
jgi:eukaryotic-like serine/threonine-protein kinase